MGVPPRIAGRFAPGLLILETNHTDLWPLLDAARATVSTIILNERMSPLAANSRFNGIAG